MTRRSTPAAALALTFALALTGTAAAADDAPALFPAGYLDHQGLTAALRKAVQSHPDRARLTSLAKSALGRDVWLVTLGPNTPDAPAVVVVANLEGDHVVGSHVALGLVERLSAAKADAPEAAWLDRVTLYVVPRLNPDGAERALGKSPAAEFRTNLRPVDRDRDGARGEDGPDDLDGDGVVTRMRVKDPLKATLVPDDKDPRRLRPADRAKGEKPVFAEEAEGRDDDGDGLRNEDPAGGVNLNRNWPHRWTEFDVEAGVSPASEPEVHGLIRFLVAHPEVAAVWTLGLNDNLREEPKKPGSDLDDADLPAFAALARAYQKATAAKDPGAGGSPAGKGAPAPGATTDGALSEWAYHQLGAVGIASRVWSTPEIPAPPGKPDDKKKDEKKKDDKPAPNARPAVPDDAEARWFYWNDHVVGGRAFVPWRPFTHPTLGPVEIGGWRPGVRLNPPAEVLPGLTATHLAFLADLAGRLPRLAVPATKVVNQGGGLFEVTAVVENAGTLPTALAQGVKTRKALPVLVKLDPAGAKFLTGRPLERIDSLPGAGGRREFRWLLLAPGGGGNAPTPRLVVSCPRAGRVEVPLPLK